MGGGQPLHTSIYYTNWAIYGRAHDPQSLPASHLTHVLYSFANIRPETGEVYLTDPWSDTDKHYPTDSWNDSGTNVYGCVKQLFLLKKANRKLKVLLSIGGWTYSSNFAAPASTQAGRQTFAASAVKLVEDLGLDGLDVDWEYPKDASEAHNFVELLKVTREALDAAARKRTDTKFLLTIACPAGPANYEKLQIKEMDEYLDMWNLMAYDYAGTWDSTTGHQANLYPSRSKPGSTPFSTIAAVEHYIRHGVAPSKIILGMPLYGRAFISTSGPGQAHGGGGEGSWEAGVWDFKALPHAGAVEHHDRELGASWSYNESSKTMVSYDTRAVVEQKAAFVKEHGLGGGMWWESSGDKPFGQGSLVQAFVDESGGPRRLDDSQNCLKYPDSRYDNVRAGFPGEGGA